MIDPRIKMLIRQQFKTMKVLLVDDMMPNIKNNIMLLEDLGFTKTNITTASNGAQAFSKLMVTKPNFIITDWNMPMVDGLTFVKKLRALEAYKDIPVIMITAEPDKKLKDVEEYVNAFLKKPYTIQYLEDIIYSVVARKLLKDKKV
ncbi:MAG: response regulator [Nitrospirae bacterium]|nr:response regulator [Nitrospirota bacterium]